MLLKASRILIALATVTSSAAFAADCVNGRNTATCTVPAGVTSMTLLLTGGGGGGGGAPSIGTGSTNYGGGGGGGGTCSITLAVTPGSSIQINAIGTSGIGGGSGLPQNGPTPPTEGTPGTAGGPTEVVYGSVTYQATGGVGGAAGTLSSPGSGGVGGTAVCPGGTATPGGTGGSGSAPVAGAGGDRGSSSAPPLYGFGGLGQGVTSFATIGIPGVVWLTFTVPAAAAESISTLSEWAMIFMASLMAMFGYSRLRNRRA